MTGLSEHEDIHQLLRRAQRLFPISHRVPVGEERPPSVPAGELTGTLDEFEEFFYHGEPGLAWDTLAILAQRTPPDPACWPLLAEVAMRMSEFDLPDTYFMTCVRKAIAASVDLRNAILALPQQTGDRERQAAALMWVKRLTEPDQNEAIVGGL
jgi:hypothetical protein